MIRLRAATPKDRDFLVALRNDEESVRFSKRGYLDADEIAADFLARPTKRAFVATVDDERAARIGYAVFETLGEGIAEISVAITPPFRGRGLARGLVEIATSLAFRSLGFRRIRAEISPENPRSMRAFQAAGYRVTRPSADAGHLACYEVRSGALPQSATAPARARGPAPPPLAPPSPD